MGLPRMGPRRRWVSLLISNPDERELWDPYVFDYLDVIVHSDWSAFCSFCGLVDDSFLFCYLSSSFLEFGFKEFIVFDICLLCLNGSVSFIYFFNFFKIMENGLLHDLI